MRLRNFEVVMIQEKTNDRQSFSLIAKSKKEAEEKAMMMTNWDWSVVLVTEI